MKALFVTTLSLLAFGAAAPAQASISNTLGGVQNFSVVPYAPLDCAGCINEYAHTAAFDTGTTTLKLYAKADYGVLKASAAATGSGIGAVAAGSATLVVADTFEINAAGLTGRQGYFRAQITMPFTSSFDNQGWMVSQGLTSFVTVNNIEGYALQAGQADARAPTVQVTHNGNDVSPDAPMILNVPFVYGDPIPIKMFMDVSVDGNTGGGGSFSLLMDASHSVYWEGISSVTDGNGNAVTGYKLTSDSGTDWTRNFAVAPAPVPEPSVAILMLAGLAAFGLRRRASAPQGVVAH